MRKIVILFGLAVPFGVKLGRSGLLGWGFGCSYVYGIWGGFVPKNLAGFVVEGGADFFDVGAVGADGFVVGPGFCGGPDLPQEQVL
jgi:hypothetical protein